jgi:integrase
VIQHYLGHRSPKTTTVYAHLTDEVRDSARGPLNALMNQL